MYGGTRFALLGALSLAMLGCDTGDTCGITPPASWEATDFSSNAAESLALRARLDAFAADAMRAAEQGTQSVDEATLQALFDDGAPSVKDITTPTWRPIVDDAFVSFVAVIDAGVQDLTDDQGQWTPGDHGGIWEVDARGINAGGIEVRQIVDKGLFGGGALYPHALTLTEGDLDPAAIEAIAALWGADATLDPDQRTDSANYSYGMGDYGPISASFVAAHAYAADPACAVERDAALTTALRTWERSLMARFVYYANAASPLLAAPGSDADLAQALHALAEGLGLGLGFLGVPSPASGPLADAGRVVTDAEVEAMMDRFGLAIGDVDASTTGAFIEDPAGYQEAVDGLEALVGEVYGLSADDVAAFRTPEAG